MFKSFTTKLHLTQTDIEVHNPKKIQIRKLELRIFRDALRPYYSEKL